jgi:hypothetical protein
MSDFDDNAGQALLGVQGSVSSSLMRMLASDDIVPGSSPSYEICKTIYTYHPFGAKMAESPIKRAQSQPRELKVAGAPEEELIAAFHKTWDELGQCGADQLILNTHALSRVYGIAAVAVLAKDIPTTEPLPMDRLHELELSFNVLDPLNTAGSLVLDQDPNSPTFMKPRGVSSAGKAYHASRTAVVMNEQPIYIEWTNSAFGFVGRSVYQRALFPLKSYVQSMITDDAVTQKAGLLVMKLKAPGSMIDKITRAFYSVKRQLLKGAKTGNVLSIGTEESIESVDLKNLRDAAEFARTNIIKNIATAGSMPATMLLEETLAKGFGEGSEDAKQIAWYIDTVRKEAAPLYRFFDDIVMRLAWTPEFYASIQRKYPEEYAEVDFITAFYRWKNAFKAQWPNLLQEPDSEKAKTDDVVTKAALSLVEVMAPQLDPENKAQLLCWAADIFNGRQTFAATPLVLDEEAIAAYEPPQPEHEPSPTVESSHL